MKAKQTAVYWANPVNDGRGKSTFDSPVEILVRWFDKQILFIAADGKEKISAAVVYKLNTTFLLGEFLFLGGESDLDSNHDDPTIIKEAKEIRGADRSWNSKATKYIMKAILV